MKTNKPCYRIFLKKTRTDANGGHPVIMRVSMDGTVERSLGFSCRPSDWDEKRQRVKPRAANSKALNAIIDTSISRYEAKRIQLDATECSYTASTLTQLVETKDKPACDYNFGEAIEMLMKMRPCSKRTKVLYAFYLKRVSEVFSETAKPSDVDTPWLTTLVSKMKEKGATDNIVFGTIGMLSSVCNFCQEQNWITTDTTVFRKFKRRYKPGRQKRRVVVTQAQVLTMYKWLFKRVYENWEEIVRPDEWNIYEVTPKFSAVGRMKMTDPTSTEFAVAFALLIYSLGGLAPCDLIRLTVGDIKYTSDGKMSLQGNRKKTSVRYFVARSMTSVMKALMLPFTDGKKDSELLLPVLSHYGRGTNPDSVFNVLGNRRLKIAVKSINDELEARKSLRAEFLPDGLTFYSFRHSFATEMLKKTTNLNAIASAMGRSVNTLGTYITELRTEADMADELDKVM